MGINTWSVTYRYVLFCENYILHEKFLTTFIASPIVMFSITSLYELLLIKWAPIIFILLKKYLNLGHGVKCTFMYQNKHLFFLFCFYFLLFLSFCRFQINVPGKSFQIQESVLLFQKVQNIDSLLRLISINAEKK